MVWSLGQQRGRVWGSYPGEALGSTHEDSLECASSSAGWAGPCGGAQLPPSAARFGDPWLPGHLGHKLTVFPRGPWTPQRRGQAPTGIWRKIYRATATRHGRRPNTLSGPLKYQFCTRLHSAARGPAQAYYLILLSLRNPVSDSSGPGGAGEGLAHRPGTAAKCSSPGPQGR